MTWSDTKAMAIDELRRAYLLEVARFAETLRPRFESGELRAMRESDDDGGMTWRWADKPHGRLERLCAAHFGLEDTDELPDEARQEAYRTANLIRSVSPGDADTEDAQPIIGQATSAVALDVIAIARARRWYVPAADEENPGLDLTWTQEARSWAS